MAAFVNRDRFMRTGPIIRSLTDVDFYKFTMGYFIYESHRGVMVKFRFINRNPRIPIAKIISEEVLRAELDAARLACISRTDISYLRGMDVYGDRIFPEAYLHFLGGLRLPSYELERVGDQYELTFECVWEEVTWWETIALAIISELLYEALMESLTPMEREILYARAIDKLYNKLKKLREYPTISFADFGQRRRFSFLWQQFVLEMAQEVLLPGQLTGTSNTWMAFNQNLTPIGTNAHELPMGLTALAEGDDAKRMAQYTVIREWKNRLPYQALQVMLPDTYGSEQFFRNMPEDLAQDIAHHGRGQRQDSGNPIEEALRYVEWLKQHGADPIKTDKINIPSDGLDVGPMIEIHQALEGVIKHPFGLGTNLTNDFRGCHPRGDEQAVVRGVSLGLTNHELFRGHSIVVKMASANGRPAVKLSNNPAKATGPRDEVEKYLRIFGSKGMETQDVIV